MMRYIVASSLRFRWIAVALAAGMVALGAVTLRDSPVDVFPEFAPPRVEIQTAALGLTAEEVESLVTVPLEESLNGVAGLDVMRSKSVAQLSSILMLFKPGTDLLEARQVVQERVAIVTPTLPPWATPPVMLQPLSSTSRVMKIGLSSDELSLMELSILARYKFRTRLMRVPGVANVAIWGQRHQQLQVMVDPERMRKNGVSLDQVMRTTADSVDAGLLQFTSGSFVGTGGYVENAGLRRNVQHVLPIVAPHELAQVPIDGSIGDPLTLSDVSDVVEEHQPLIGDAVINDGPGLMLIVEKLPWGNTLEVTKGVEEAVEALEPGLPDVAVDTTIFRPATFIETALDNLTNALLLGCLLVVLVLGAFLFTWRTAVISLVAIPLSLVAAGLVLHWQETTVNTMVLAGLIIAVGVVVDDAIIDIENIVRRLRQMRGGRQPDTVSFRSTAGVVLRASMEVRQPIVYATLIIVAAAVPIFFLEGLTGSFFRPLAWSYTLAVLASMVVALTVTPALALIMLARAPLSEDEPPLVRLLQRGYVRVLRRIVTRPKRAYGTVAVVALAGALALPTLGQSMLPSFKERDFLMHWLGQPGTGHPEMVRISTLASKELRDIDGVRNFGAHIGQAVNADEVVGIDFGENWISVAPEADYDQTLARVQGVVDGYPGLFRDVQTYLKERVREVLTGSGNAVVVRLFGPDLDTLRTEAKDILAVLASVDGLVEQHIDLQVAIPQVEVEVDLGAAQRLGVKPGDVRRMAATMFAGEEVNDLFRQGKAFDVRVWSTPESRRSLDDIRAMPVDLPDGGTVELREVADVRVAATPNAIEREAGSRHLDVTANFRGEADLGAIVADIERGLAQLDYPQGYHVELLGEYTERQAAQQRLLLYSGLALVAVALLLQLSFGSWRLAMISLFTLPMALVGGVLAAVMGGGIVSLGSLVGFLTVMGIAARNGILMIAHCQHLERHEGVPFGPELVLRGARERLAPILMTTLATGLAIVPLVMFGNLPGHEIEHPMAVVILGGLVTSTLLNLFVVPSLYLRFAPSRTLQPATA